MKKIVLGVISSLSLISVSYAQIFEQNFISGQVIGQYVNAQNPDKNQFTYISSHGTQRASIVNGALRFNKTGSSSAQLVRAIPFQNNPDFLYISFKYTISGNKTSHPTDLQARFFVGDGLTNTPALPIDSINVNSKFSFHYTANGAFKIRDIATGVFSPEFYGQQQITFVINNSGKEKTYNAPGQVKEKIANGKWDLWIGIAKIFDDKDVTNAKIPLNGFKFQVQAGAIDAITEFDDFIIHDFKSLSSPNSNKATLANHKQNITVTHKWLSIPVKNKATKRNISLEVDGKTFRSFSVELANEKPDWFAYVDLSSIKGKTLQIIVDTLDKKSKAFSNIKQLNEKPKEPQLYKEPYRGQIHFSAAKGWNNDPNGMVHYNGEYHLFYQYNPYGNRWGNMHWGHAVSKDLVHWKELDIALYPDEMGMMYSGGGVVDVGNTSKLSQKSNQDPMVIFYTATGPPRVQAMAYSTDGRNFEKLNQPVLEEIRPGNRDPKVFWHEPTKKWIMVLYVAEKGEQHTMVFLTSINMKDWQKVSSFHGGKGSKDKYLYECPEFYELAVDGNTNEKKWVLVGADGQYTIGTFDGKEFKAEQERLTSVIGTGYYAGQQFSNEPKGRKIEIGWFRANTDQVNMNFSQSLSIPMELKLTRTPQGIRLSRTPIDELKSLRKQAQSFKNLTIDHVGFVKDTYVELQEINAVIAPGQQSLLSFTIRGINFSYDAVTEQLIYKNHKVSAPLINGKLTLHIYVDRTGIELFANNGLVYLPININMDQYNTTIKIKADNTHSIVETLDIYELKSIW